MIEINRVMSLEYRETAEDYLTARMEHFKTMGDIKAQRHLIIKVEWPTLLPRCFQDLC